VEEGAIVQLKMNRSRKTRGGAFGGGNVEALWGRRPGPQKVPHGLLPEEREKILEVARSEEYVDFSHRRFLNHYGMKSALFGENDLSRITRSNPCLTCTGKT